METLPEEEVRHAITELVRKFTGESSVCGLTPVALSSSAWVKVQGLLLF